MEQTTPTEDRASVIAFRATRYRCPHCRRSGSHRRQMEEHAASCIKDPNTKACATCASDESHWLKSDSGALTRENGCAKGCREYGKTLVKHCPSWEPKPVAGEDLL